jgi:ribose transport system substrate-binding protein
MRSGIIGMLAGAAMVCGSVLFGVEKTIGVSVLSMNNPFFKEIADSITAEGARNGFKVAVVSGDFDVAKQQNQVKDFIVRKVSAIILCPCDSKAIGPAIKEANAAGIPVFTADIACLDKQAEVVSHVATDNYLGGKLAAEAIVEATGGNGKMAILDYPEIESVIMRTKGFEDKLAEMKKTNPEITLAVVAKLTAGGDKAKGLKVTQDLLQAYPDLNAIFAINDPSALGAVAALDSAGKTGKIIVVGFDGQPEGRKAIRDGKIYADPIQFPDKIGLETMKAVMKYMKGEDVSREILIPTALYKKSDAEKDKSLK